MVEYFKKIYNFRQKILQDPFFAVVCALYLVVPLAMDWFVYDKYETPKYAFFLIFTALAGLYFTLKIFRQTDKLKIGLPKPAVILLLAFIFWLCLSCFFSWSKIRSVFGMYPNFIQGLAFLFFWVILIFILSAIEQRNKYLFLFQIVEITAVLNSVYAIFQAFGLGLYLGPNISLLRAPAFLGNPNFTAGFIAIVLPLAFYFYFQAANTKQKIWHGFAIICQALALALLSSRGAILAALPGFFVMLIYGFYKIRGKNFLKYFIASGIILAVLAGLFIKIRGVQNWQSVVNFNDGNVSTRVQVWNLAAEATLSRPWFGVGLSNFQLVFEQERQTQIGSGFFADPHNLFLNLAATSGLPAALLFIAILLAGFYVSLKKFFLFKDPLYLANGFAICAFTIACMFNPTVLAQYVALAALLAFSFKKMPETGNNLSIKIKSRWAGLIKFIGIGLALAIIVFALAFFTAEHLFFSGRSEFFAGNTERAKKLLSFPAILYPANEMYFYYNLAAQIKTSGNSVMLENQIKTIPQKFPNQSQAYLKQARLYFMLAKYTGDKKYFQNVSLSLKEAARLNPFSVEILYAQAGFELLMGNPDAALVAASRNINISPDNPYAWIMLAEIKKAKQDKAGALEALSRASALWPENAFLKKVLSQAKTSNNVQDIWLPVDWPRVENFDL